MKMLYRKENTKFDNISMDLHECKVGMGPKFSETIVNVFAVQRN